MIKGQNLFILAGVGVGVLLLNKVMEKEPTTPEFELGTYINVGKGLAEITDRQWRRGWFGRGQWWYYLESPENRWVSMSEIEANGSIA